jgi:hypothetical protein
MATWHIKKSHSGSYVLSFKQAQKADEFRCGELSSDLLGDALHFISKHSDPWEGIFLQDQMVAFAQPLAPGIC